MEPKEDNHIDPIIPSYGGGGSIYIYGLCLYIDRCNMYILVLPGIATSPI